MDRFSTEDFRSNAGSTNCQGQDLQFTPRTFVPALLHQLSEDRISNSHRRLSLQRCSTNRHRTGSPLHTEDFRSNAAQPTVKDRFCQFTLEDFRSSAAPPTVKDRFSNSHRRLSFQRCSTNCQGQVLQFTPKIFVPALIHQLSRRGSPIHTEHYRSSAAPPTVKDRFSNSHQRLSFQRCSTSCQGRDLQLTMTFVPTLPHQLSKTSSPIHTEDFRSSAAPPTVKDEFSNSHRRLSLQRCSSNCQGQGFPIHTEDFRSSAAPPTVKDRFSNSRRRLSFQRWSTNCQGQVFQFTPKTVAPALLHQLSRTGFSKSRRKLSFQRCSTNFQGQDLQFTPKTFAPALLHQLSKTCSTKSHRERDLLSSAESSSTVKEQNT